MTPNIPNTTAICPQCGKSFEYYKCHATQNRTFCSPQCFYLSVRKKWVEKICIVCGKTYRVRDSIGKYAQRKSCSSKCSGKLAYWRNREKLQDKIVANLHGDKYKPWTDEERDTLINNYSSKGAKWCSETLGRSMRSIYMAASRYGVRIPLEVRSATASIILKEYLAKNGSPMNDPILKQRNVLARFNSLGEDGRERERQRLMACTRNLRLKNSSKLQESVRDKLLNANLSFQYEYVINGNFTVDIAFTDKMLIVQVDGCYWHGHSCRKEQLTKSQLQQIKRDRSQDAYCYACGYEVIRIWECEINKDWDSCYSRIISRLMPTM